jgi:hypothetical protein
MAARSASTSRLATATTLAGQANPTTNAARRRTRQSAARTTTAYGVSIRRVRVQTLMLLGSAASTASTRVTVTTTAIRPPPRQRAQSKMPEYLAACLKAYRHACPCASCACYTSAPLLLLVLTDEWHDADARSTSTSNGAPETGRRPRPRMAGRRSR